MIFIFLNTICYSLQFNFTVLVIVGLMDKINSVYVIKATRGFTITYVVIGLVPRPCPAGYKVASFLGCRAWVGRKEPGTHCLRMLSFPRISGNLEISRKTCSVTLTSARTPTSLV